ncbi:MAG: hypothetical protein HYY93_02260 [Planctomycetes bacterium]|nr:hypothetical protein [Planctomycetota bacterium]
MPLDLVTRRLDTLRRQARSLILYDGLSRVLLAAALAACVTFAIDYLIPYLPREVRLTLLALSVLVVVLVFYRRVILPLRVTFSDDRLALYLEQQYPQLGDRLISALQLSRSSDQFSRFNSPVMVTAVVDDAVRQAEPLDFGRVVRSERVRRLCGWTGVTLAVLVGLGFWQSALAGIWLNRLLGGDARWPLSVELQVVTPGDRVAKGEDYAVQVRVLKGRPSKGTITFRFEGAAEEEERLTRRTDTEFVYAFQRVSDSFQFHVTAGDYRSETISVKALTPPRIDRLCAFLHYPKYTGLTDTPPERPEEGGHLKVPSGTRIQIRAHANIPLASAQLLVGPRGNSRVEPSKIEPDELKEPKVVSGEFQVFTDTEYALSLTATNGLGTGGDPIRYTVRVVIDVAPAIKIVKPGIDKVVTPTATVPLAAQITDDFGISSIALIWKLSSGESPAEKTVPFDITMNSDRYGAKKIDSAHTLDMAAWGAKEGDIFQYWLTASDNHDSPGPNTTKSHVYQIQVRARNELERRLEEVLMKMKEDVRRTAELQKGIQRTLEDSQTALGTRDSVTGPERESLRANATRQRQVTQKSDSLGKQMAEVLEDLQNNKLWDVGAQARLADIRALLDEIAKAKSPNASELMTAGANARTGADRATRLGEASRKQTEIGSDFTEILQKMDEWEDYQEIVRIFRELREQVDDAGKRIKNTGGK